MYGSSGVKITVPNSVTAYRPSPGKLTTVAFSPDIGFIKRTDSGTSGRLPGRSFSNAEIVNGSPWAVVPLSSMAVGPKITGISGDSGYSTSGWSGVPPVTVATLRINPTP